MNGKSYLEIFTEPGSVKGKISDRGTVTNNVVILRMVMLHMHLKELLISKQLIAVLQWASYSL